MKRNHLKKNKLKKSSLAESQERLSNFQKKSPHKFRQVFDHYQKGQRELNQGIVNDAKTSFEKALTIYPEYIPAQNYLAVIYGLLGNFKEALLFVKKVIKLDGRNVFALIQGAIFLYRLQRGKEAEGYAEKALIAFKEREGIDPYHDYDMLQKLAEMLSVLRLDKDLCELYNARKTQLSPISLYRSALALCNEEKYTEACSVLKEIKENSLKEKSTYLAQSIELFVQEELPIPMLLAEEETGFEQLMAILPLFTGEEQQKQTSLKYLKKHYNNWSLAVQKNLLVSKKLEDWVKKGILSILADWGEADKPVNIVLDGVEQQISLQAVELELSEELTELFVTAKELLTKGEISESISKLKFIKEASPMYIPVYVQLANAYLQLNEYENVEVCLNEAMNIATLAQVSLTFSKYYEAIGERQKAFEKLTSFDTRELENVVDVYEAIELKVKVVLNLFGSEKARGVLLKEKEKFQVVLNDWDTFEERMSSIIVPEAKLPLNGEEITKLLESYTKDKLIETVKAHKIRGYSKLNKKDLIELIKREIYEKGLLGK